MKRMGLTTSHSILPCR